MDSWANLCRCCLSPDSEVSLLDEVNNVKEKFLEITTVEVHESDGLPQKLCNNCFSIMTSAYQFRRQCIKMDTELKFQLKALLLQNKENQIEVIERQESQDATSDDDIANNPMKQLQAIIKQEPTDSDDDYYYVLVIDDPKDKEGDNKIDKEIEEQSTEAPITEGQTTEGEGQEENARSNVKVEVDFEKPNADHDEQNQSIQESQEESNQPGETFENSYDSFLMSNTKVPINVPATILENEEESQETDEQHFDQAMDVVENQDCNSQDQNYALALDGQDKDIEEVITGDIDGNLQLQDNNIIKILTTSGANGTIILKDSDGIQYLTTDTQLVTSTGEDGDPMDQEQVIFCEGDDSSQFQILKCDGSELVIEYADGDQIATVLQQEDGTFLCDCGEQFEDLGEYEKHQYRHNPAGEHLCNLCGKGFETAEILTGHMLLHSSGNTSLIGCPFCQQLIRRNTLTQHIKYSHNNVKPECNICMKTFANPNNLKRHQMIHTGVREFECDLCLKRFHQKITMQTHRLTHLNPFACNQCDQTFESKTGLQAHKESDSCSRSKIKKVKDELMKTVKQEVTTNLGKLLGYACSLCKKMFSLESALEQHVEVTHMSHDPSELLCSECGEVLPTVQDMQAHVMTHKNCNKKQMKRFECKSCGKGCSSQAMLIMHERVHTNERPFPCALCSLRFKTKTHLRTHQLTHTREKKFGCSVCMKFFALKGNLVVHLRTHTGERPYSCTLCGESFIDSKYLKKHKLKKHAIENVPWNQY